MKCLSVLLAACLGTFVYVSTSITGGHDGILAEKKLAEQKRQLSVRTAEIQKINTELSLEFTAIQMDPDVIAAFARQLGYVGKNEKLVKITGLPSAPVMSYNTGTVLKHQSITCLPEWVCKAMGFTVFLCAFVFMLLLDYRHTAVRQSKRQKTHKVSKEIPVYDLPQI